MNRVMLVTTGLGLGGAEVQVVQLARRLTERGWVVQVVSLIEPGGLADELREVGIPVASLQMRSPASLAPGALRLVRLLWAWRPDVVHAHMFHANLLCRLVRPLAPIPVLICTAHSTYEAGSGVKNKREVTWRERAYRISDFLCDVTTQISEAGLRRYVAVGAVNPRKVRVVRNGIDTGTFSPSAGAREQLRRELGVERTFVWLAVGRLAAPKDYPTLLRAVALLKDRGLVLLIAGEGQLRGDLENLAHALGVDGQVSFLGVRRDMPRLMSAADAFVLSSVWEGSPLVVAEAMACELPVVATDVGGVPELLDGGG